jgi:hypothetical protein
MIRDPSPVGRPARVDVRRGIRGEAAHLRG